MTTYNVQLKETVRYVLMVEADSEQEATETAIELWNQGDTGEQGGDSDGVQVGLVLVSTIQRKDIES